MISPDSPIVIFGAGSIGERYIGILQQLGYINLAVFRQRNLPLRNSYPYPIQVLTSDTAVLTFGPKAALICTPTSLHTAQALFCLKNRIPVLVEKPLAHSVTDIAEIKSLLQQNQSVLQVGYMLRYHPLMVRVKQWIEERRWGNLISQQSYWGEYLPDWHPWENYRQSYAARKDLGGGAALTLSHDIDAANWMANSAVTQWTTLKSYASELEIDVESGADISIGYQNGTTAHCHVNFHEKTPRRFYRYVFSDASIEINYLDNELLVLRPGLPTERIVAEGFQRNDMFISQIKDFFGKIEIGYSDSLSYINESEKILQICIS